MASHIDFEALRAKLRGLSGSQQSIETLSLYFSHHGSQHAKLLVQIWYEEFMQVPAPKKLPLLYLANDILQRTHKKREYNHHMKHVLEKAMSTACRENSKIVPKVNRIIDIWEERLVFAKDFLRPLKAQIANPKQSGESRSSSRDSLSASKHSVALVQEFNQSLAALRESQETDKLIFDQASALPSTIFDVDSMFHITDIDVGNQAMKQCEDACAVLGRFQGCKAAEFEDRTNLMRTLVKMLELQKTSVNQLKQRQKSCSVKYKALTQLEQALPTFKVRLHDMNDKKRKLESEKALSTSTPEVKKPKPNAAAATPVARWRTDRWADVTPLVTPPVVPPRPKNTITTTTTTATATASTTTITTPSARKSSVKSSKKSSKGGGRLRPWELGR